MVLKSFMMRISKIFGIPLNQKSHDTRISERRGDWVGRWSSPSWTGWKPYTSSNLDLYTCLPPFSDVVTRRSKPPSLTLILRGFGDVIRSGGSQVGSRGVRVSGGS